MAFMRKESKSPEPTQQDPLKLTITQFKFSPQIPTQKVKLCLNPEPARDYSSTYQLPRRGLSFRSDRQKKIERLSQKKVIEIEDNSSTGKAQMFMTWRQRSTSVKKMYVPADKLLLEVMKNNPKETPQRIYSEKKLTPINFDLDLRRNKVQTAARIKGNSPMELLTRKLQWRGREVKRAVPKTSDPKSQRIVVKEDRINKIFFSSLNGWQPEQNHLNEFLPGGLL